LADEGPELPTLGEFLPPAFLFEGTPFAINRLDLIRLVVVIVVLAFFGITASRAYKRSKQGNHLPTKPQSVVEIALGFIKSTVYDVLGEEVGRKWVPMATTLCCTIFFCNITGIVPGLNIAATAGIGIPLLFGLWVFTAYWRQGIKEYGGGVLGGLRFVKAELFPKGLPFYVYPIYAVIELAQLLIIRPFSLALRLFANMLAGHILLALCFAATQYFIFVASPAMKPLGAVTLIGALAFACFEIVVAALQAYIFTLLMCAYISMSFNHEVHDEEGHDVHIEEEISTVNSFENEREIATA
jgi:F-type H+-transporting ATPase subunit a